MENIEDKLMAAVLAAAVDEQMKAGRAERRRHLRFAVPAIAAAGLAACLLIPSGPRDTFEDPAEAYAELVRTFTYISAGIDRGTEIASKAEEPIETVKNIFE